LGHGGGTITWKYKGALLFALAMVITIVPSVEGLQNQNTLDGNTIGLNEDVKNLEVNAASATTKKVKKYTHKKVKAASTTKKTNPTSTSSGTSSTSSGVGAYNVVVTPTYIIATGKGTCSLDTDYNYHTRVFENYDPSSHEWGVLKFEQGSGNNNPEGMWYSTITDMDFCLVHGKSHDNRGVYLIPYNGTINGKKVVNGYFV